ncbi:MAG: hypothetical protein QF824_04960 [Candidatus Woesearchaeota archaeon]|nr:hypothetical protein [Candidatus Woesearchaeota archaeon]
MQHVPEHNEEEHKAREEHHEQIKVEKTGKKNKMWIIAGVVLLVAVSVSAFAFLSPGTYDNFAKCLTEKGAVMYGEDWCQYTNGQKAMFGKSFKHVTYVVKSDLAKRPTWVIDGESYETVQSFERLAALTGCEY